MKIEVPIEIVSLEENNYHLLVEVKINEELKGKMVIDTGASKTVLDSNLPNIEKAEQEDQMQSSGIGGAVEVVMAQEVSLRFGAASPLVLSNIALIDLEPINELYQKATSFTIIGLLGSDLLKKYSAVINYETQLLLLKKDSR